MSNALLQPGVYNFGGLVIGGGAITNKSGAKIIDDGLNPADIPGLVDYVAKGDIATANAALDAEVVSIGTTGQVLTVDLTTSTGVKWATQTGCVDTITLTTTPFTIKDNATPTSSSLFKITNNGGTSTYLDIRANCIGFGNGCDPTLPGQVTQSSGQFSTAGDANTSQYVMFRETTDGSTQDLYLDGVGSLLTVPDNSTTFFNIVLVANEQSSTNIAAYKFEFTVLKQVGGATITMGLVDKYEVESVSAWGANVSVNTTDGTMRLNVTGTSGATIRWVARVTAVQVRF
jgi:hypothetical protein